MATLMRRQSCCRHPGGFATSPFARYLSELCLDLAQRMAAWRPAGGPANGSEALGIARVRAGGAAWA
eukprot:7425736-Lingulodinium_polyedra.AAC.1